MSAKPKKYSRTKVIYNRPNALFEKWLTEWKDEAEKKDSNLKYVYQRALKSLKKFPLPLRSGQECKVLSHCGDKICKMLDEKLQEHIAINGPINWDDTRKTIIEPVKKATGKAVKKKEKPTQAKRSIESNQSKTSPDNQNKSGSGSGKKAKTGREYIPAERSGPYAILIALYNSFIEPNYPGYMKKSEIMEKAQDFCDSSFYQAPDGSHYTAWSSMSNLLKKDLVSKEGNPPRFSLTDSGMELAAKIQTIDASISSNSRTLKRKSTDTQTQKKSSLSQNLNLDEDSDDDQDFFDNVEEKPKDLGFDFTYIDPNGKETTMRSEAKKLDDSSQEFLGYLITCKITHLLNSDALYLFDDQDDRVAKPGCTFAYLSQSDAPLMSTTAVDYKNKNTKKSNNINKNTKKVSTRDTNLGGSDTMSPAQKRSRYSFDTNGDDGVVDLCDKIEDDCDIIKEILSPVRINSNAKSNPNNPVEIIENNCNMAPEDYFIGTKNNSTLGFDFTYIDERGKEVCDRDKAKIIDDEAQEFSGFLIKCKLTKLLNSDVEFLFEEDDRQAIPGFTYAYIAKSQAPLTSNKSKTVSKKTENRTKSIPTLNTETSPIKYETIKESIPLNNTSLSPNKKLVDKIKLCDKEISHKEIILEDEEIITEKEIINKNKGTEKNKDDFELPEIFVKPSRPNKNAVVDLNEPQFGEDINQKEIYDTSSPDELSFEYLMNNSDFSLNRNNFEVVLCVDTAEVTGGFSGNKKTTKEIIINELNRNCINYNVRKLNIGDFLWICREKCTLTKSKPRELVLPYIVERKRMDDLASSILDGRFREQKFRIKRTALTHPIYLVELYGSKNACLPKKTCDQAIMSTRIKDGFQVKITADQKRSAEYLASMTKLIQNKYNNETIYSVSKDLYVRLNETSSLPSNKTHVFLQEFDDFNQLAMKNKSLSIQDMFAKHLLQIFGLTPLKARAIIDQYPTVSHLIRAYNKCKSDHEKQEMLSNIKFGDGKKSIGSTISIHIFNLYCNKILR